MILRLVRLPFAPRRRALRPFALGVGTLALLTVLAACASPSSPTPDADEGTEPDRVAVAIEASSTSLMIGERRTFRATLEGADPSTVTWTPSCGTVEGAGAEIAYAAPMEDGTCSLTAGSTADPRAQHTIFLTVHAPGSPEGGRMEPNDASVRTGGRIEVQAQLEEVSSSDIGWSATCGTVEGRGRIGLYQAPNEAGTCIVTAASERDPARSASSTFTVDAPDVPVTVRVAPERASVVVGSPLLLQARIEGADDPNATWTASCGSIFGSGPTATFQAPNTPGRCTVTARSAADPSKTATSSITVDPMPVETGVTINPTRVSVEAGRTTTLEALVRAEGETSLTWSTTCGSIREADPPGGPTPMQGAQPSVRRVTYEAPPSSGSCTVTAALDSAPDAPAEAVVTVTPPPLDVTVDVAPSRATLTTEGTLTLTTTVDVAGEGSDAVSWTTTCGSLEPTETGAIFTAPSAAQTCVATATSVADPSRSASATITLREPIDVVVSPGVAVLAPDEARTFEAVVHGSDAQAIEWSTTCGRIEGDGPSVTYVAPPEPGSCVVTATSTEDPSAQFRSSVVVEAPTSVSIDPSDATMTVGTSRAFGANVTGSAGGSVDWSTTCGTISGVGTDVTYVAPMQPGTCSVTATSTADPSQSARAVVTVEENVRLSLAPTEVTLDPETEQTFTASVTGTGDRRVSWDATCGTVAGDGLEVVYRAPDGTNECNIIVTSVANPEVSVPANVTVTERPVSPPEPGRGAITPFVAAGNGYNLLVNGEGFGFAWGVNNLGQLGNGTWKASPDPTEIQMPEGVTIRDLDAADGHTLALDGDGRVWAWGKDYSGQLGNDPLREKQAKPRRVALDSDIEIVDVGIGGGHSLAVDAQGRIWSWGWDANGALGDGLPIQDRSTPVAVDVPTGTRFVAADGGYTFSVALDDEGRLWSWGGNQWGQLGHGESATDEPTLTPTPVQIPAGVTFDTFSASLEGVVALDVHGHAWAWGFNRWGQVGNGEWGSGVLAPAPVNMPQGIKFQDVVAAQHFSLALDANGGVWAWGSNYLGRLGIGEETWGTLEPIRVPLPEGTVVTSIDSYTRSVVAYDEAGNLWGWGIRPENNFSEPEDGVRYLPERLPLP